jgi:hypothetical protein
MNRYDAHLIAEELYKLMKADNPLGGDSPMTSEEAAEYLHISNSHFSHIAIRLPRVKAGRRWLYPKSKIIESLTK